MNKFPIAAFNYLVKRFILCTLTLEEAKKAAKNVIRENHDGVWNPQWTYWNKECVAASFVWCESPEGQEYWSKIDRRLCRR